MFKIPGLISERAAPFLLIGDSRFHIKLFIKIGLQLLQKLTDLDLLCNEVTIQFLLQNF